MSQGSRARGLPLFAVVLWLALPGQACRRVPAVRVDAGAPADAALPADRGAGGESVSADLAAELPPPAVGQPCEAQPYLGWSCREGLSLPSPPHGEPFELAVRWNAPTIAPSATVIWLGRDGRSSPRGASAAGEVQDRLLLVDKIRSVEVVLGGGEGLLRAPRLGLPALGPLLNNLVDELARQRITAGKWVALVAEDLAASAVAAGLARHRLDDRLDRIVLLAGPAMIDLGLECGDPQHWTYLGERSDLRQRIDAINGWQDAPVCVEAVPPGAAYVGRSVLGGGAEQIYSGVAINVLLGADDEQAPWLLRSSQSWYEQIAGQRKSKHLFAGVGHAVTGDGPGPAGDAVQAVLDAIYAYARSRPPTEAFSKPLLVYSKAEDGPPASQFGPDELVHGRVANIGPDARGCREPDDARGPCAELGNWTVMPTPDWTYDAQNRVWRTNFRPVDWGMTPGTIVHGWFRDDGTAQLSDRVTIKVF